PRGWLRVTAPYSLGIERLAPLLGQFHARHPEVRIEMLLSNEPLDLIDKEIDVALRVGNLPDSNLVARRLSVLRTQVYGSPAYLERHGEPLHPDDLQHHRTFGMQKMMRNGNYCWPLSDGERTFEYRIEPILVANDPAAVRGALLCGEGLMLASDIMVRAHAEHGQVRRVLEGWTGPEFDLNALFPRGQVTSPKVRAFVDFLVERLHLDADYMESLCPNRVHREKARAEASVSEELARVAREQRLEEEDAADVVPLRK